MRLLRHAHQRSTKIARALHIATQAAHPLAAIGRYLLGHGHGRFQLGADRIAGRKFAAGGMQPQDQSLRALQQGVVQLACDPLALAVTLVQPCTDACGQLPQPAQYSSHSSAAPAITHSTRNRAVSQ